VLMIRPPQDAAQTLSDGRAQGPGHGHGNSDLSLVQRHCTRQDCGSGRGDELPDATATLTLTRET